VVVFRSCNAKVTLKPCGGSLLGEFKVWSHLIMGVFEVVLGKEGTQRNQYNGRFGRMLTSGLMNLESWKSLVNLDRRTSG
jgi:hypothetical protein